MKLVLDRMFDLQIEINRIDRIFDLEILIRETNLVLILNIKQMSPLGFGKRQTHPPVLILKLLVD